MTIGEFYLNKGKTSLHISIYFIVFAFLLAIILILARAPAFSVTGIMAISFIYFFIHLYYVRKSMQVSPFIQNNRDTDIPAYYLIRQDQREIYFFAPSGQAFFIAADSKDALGNKIEIRRFDHPPTLFRIEKDPDHYIFKNEQGEITAYFNKGKTAGEIVFQYKKAAVFSTGKTGAAVLAGKKVIATVKVGWLPLEWTRLFQLNTPVIQFYENIPPDEMDSYICAFAFLLRKS